MNNREKRDVIINKGIDISHNRLKDYEVDSLYKFVTRADEYIGRKEHRSYSHDGWCSDGKFTRTENYDYEITDSNGLGINENYCYKDDDGDSYSYCKRHSTGREILKLLNLFI